MTLKKAEQKIMSIWVKIKPFAIPLLIITLLSSLALLIAALVWLYDEQDITFLILIISNIAVLGIFALGFLIVGARSVVLSLIRKEEVRCIQCDKIMRGRGLYCSSCRKENKDI